MDKTTYKKAIDIRMWLGTALQKERQKYQATPICPDMIPHMVAQGWGYVVAGYFLIEQGLKAVLHMRDNAPPRTHDLSCLFAKLCAQDQKVLRTYYDDFRGAAPGMSKFPLATLDDFLENLDGGQKGKSRHTGSFDWRYFLTEEGNDIAMPLVSIDFMHEVVEGCVHLIGSIDKGDDKADKATYSWRLQWRRLRHQHDWLMVRMNLPGWGEEGNRIELLWGPDYAGRYDYLVFKNGRIHRFFAPIPDAEKTGLETIDKRCELDSFDAKKGLRSIGIIVD